MQAIAGLFVSAFLTLSAAGQGSGLTGAYYDNADFTALKFSRVDPGVNFVWGASAPTNTMGADTYSVRWSGQLEPRYSETYTFYVTADDGARLWVNDRLVLARTKYSAAAQEMAGCIHLEAGQHYNIMLEFIENSGNAQVRLEWSSASQPREVIPPSQLYPATGLREAGAILVEHWMNLPGTNVSALLASPNYPNHPDGREFLTSFECLQSNWADNYGTRASGFLLPPTNGSYVFAVSGDDAVQLFLSTDGTAANKRLIASNAVPTGFRQFTNSPGQVSAPIALTGLQKYYVELLHKEGSGSDHFSVAWQRPGETNFSVISDSALVPGGLDRSPPAQTNYLDTLVPGHPRLFASAERFEWLKRTVASNSIPQLTSWWGTLSNSAVSILTQPVNVYAPDVRGTILNTSRSVMDRVYKCALAYWMTGDTNFAERAWTEMQQVCSTNFPDWHPAHFLDTAEMTHACAVGYDWLYGYLSQARRDTIRTAIINKGLNQSLSLYTNSSGWVAASANNWNLVCNGGMIMGALAVGTENESLAEYILYKAVNSAGAVMRHYTTDNGGWYEGPGYWDYTTEYNTHLMAGLESALGSDFGLSDTAGLAETGLEALYMVGPNKLSFNYADAGAGNIRGPQLLWLARRFNRPEFSWWERNNAAVEVLDLLWYDARGTDPKAAGLQQDNYFHGPTGTTSFSPAEAVTLRTRWQDSEATFIGFKAGDIGASHGHLDGGNFVLDALGVRWAHDLGSDDYALPGYFSEPQRWTYYRLRAEGHNTLVINPGASADQVVGSKLPVLLYTSEPNAERAAVVADLTGAYGITKAWRGIQLFQNRRWVLVQDELQAATPANVWWFMHINTATSAAIQTNGSSVMLTQGGDRLWLNILSGGGSFVLSNAVPLPTSPNPSGQNLNSGFRKLAIHLTNVTNTTLAVLMVPLGPGENPPANSPALTALVDWGVGTTNSVTVPTNTAPSTAASTVTTAAGTPVDVDLRGLAWDGETAVSNLWFGCLQAANGTVSLLPDGHTARFVPAGNFTGVTSFKFTVSDAWPDSRLLVYYNFEPPESNGDGFIADQSGHSFYGELATVGSGTNALDPDVPAVLAAQDRQSLLLRESGDFNGARLSAPVSSADLDFNSQDWTMAGWFKRSTSTNDDFVFYLGNSDGFGSPDEFQLYCPQSQNNLTVRHYIGSGLTDLDLTVPNIRTGEWHHVALTFRSTNANSGIVSFYVDGVQAGVDPAVTLNMASGVYFGGHGAANYAVTRWFNGRLDDLGIFSAVLSPAEIAQLAAQPIAYLGGSRATNTVFVNVLPVNHPPVLTAAPSQALIAGQTLWATNRASDPDSPAQNLVFSLLSAPAGAVIDPATGVVSWRPPLAQAGMSNQFQVVVTEAGWPTTLSPLADAYVRDGSFSTSNFGAASTLEVKLSPSAGFSRQSFLQFDLSALAGGIARADLRLTALTANTPGMHAVALATNNGWGEMSLTWSNKPATASPVASWLPQAGNTVLAPVTALAQASLNGQRLLSLCVQATNSTSDGSTSYASRESLSNAPALLLVTTNGPALSATQSFWVTVNAPARPTLSSAASSGHLLINGASGPDYTVEGSTNLVDWTVLMTTNSPSLPLEWSEPASNAWSQRFYRVRLGP